MKFNETNLPEMYSKGLFEEKCMDLAPEHTDKMFDIIFTATADLLNQTKSKDQVVAFIFRKLDKSFIAAAKVQYFENEDKKNPGNWSLVWTFDEADIPTDKACLKIDFTDAQTHSFFISAAGSKYGMQFKSDAMLVDCLTFALLQLRKWLDENAKEGAETVIELDGIFQARAAVEKGEKVFAIEPDGEIKNLIKSDSMIEK